MYISKLFFTIFFVFCFACGEITFAVEATKTEYFRKKTNSDISNKGRTAKSGQNKQRRVKKTANSSKGQKKTSTKRKKNTNTKNVEKISVLDDNNIIDLIDRYQEMAFTTRAIKVRTKGKGVPKMCKIPVKKTPKEVKKQDNELEEAKKDLKSHIKFSLEQNGVSEELIDYLMHHFKYVKQTKKIDKAVRTVSVHEKIQRYDYKKRSKLGIFYKKMYADVLQDVENLFSVDKEIILTIWAMETNYGSFIGSYDAFNALYSACMNAYSMSRLRFFEENIIALAMLVDRGYFKRDVISSFDGGLGGCQFMPVSFYKFAVSMNGEKADIINNNADVFASIGNYMFSMGWRFDEGVLTEIELPQEGFDICLTGLDTTKTIKEWKELGVKLHKNKIGSEFFENDDKKASIIITDVNRDEVDKSKKRAFLVYDNFRVILGYNQHKFYAVNAGLLYEEIRKN